MKSVEWPVLGLALLLLGEGSAWAAVAAQGGAQIRDVAMLQRDITR